MATSWPRLDKYSAVAQPQYPSPPRTAIFILPPLVVPSLFSFVRCRLGLAGAVGSYELLRPNSFLSYRSPRQMASRVRPKKTDAESAENPEKTGRDPSLRSSD